MQRDYKSIVLSAFSSTMSVHRDYRRYLPHYVFLTLLVASCTAREICDKTKCPGPLHYYHTLNCTPVYKNPNDCCPEVFNCSHLVNLSKDKCYVNGHEYNVGEKLRDEDAKLCHIHCMCMRGYAGQSAKFMCSLAGCERIAYFPNYNCLKTNSLGCCVSSPNCCEDIEPYCKYSDSEFCDPLFLRPSHIQHKCAPFFFKNQNPQTDCSFTSRCQHENDSVIHNHDAKSVSATDESKMCVFGNLTMHIGDTLTEGEDYNSFCVKCTCEVPPFPTCVKKTNCDYSKLFTIDTSS